MRTDYGPPFDSNAFKEFCSENGIVLEHSLPYRSEANGQIERSMSPIKHVLMCAKLMKKDWRKALKDHTRNYNNTPHRSTGIAPFVALNGRKMNIGLPTMPGTCHVNIDREAFKEREKEAKIKAKEYQDKYANTKQTEVKIGDKLLKDSKLTLMKEATGEIILRDRSSVAVFVPNEANIVRDELLRAVKERKSTGRVEINEIPIEFFPSDDEVVKELQLKETIEKEISKQVAQEVKKTARPRRACRDQTDANLKKNCDSVRSLHFININQF